MVRFCELFAIVASLYQVSTARANGGIWHARKLPIFFASRIVLGG
jgi:hypothetical protein